MIPPGVVDKLRAYLDEDLGLGDITSELLVPEGTRVRARIVAKEAGVLAGVEEVEALLRSLGIDVVEKMGDGAGVAPGDSIMVLEGDARTILAAERVALNLLMHMSGIATATRRLLEKARKANPEIRIAATRKTLPGLRYFEKKAVSIGGGDTHRLRLDDMVLIKDNHLKIVGSVRRAVELASARSFSKKVEVEVESVEEALEAAEAGADAVMFDNMEPGEIRRAVEILEERGLRERLLLEASGGIREDDIEEYASTGVDVISLGSLTLSPRALDMSLEIVD